MSEEIKKDKLFVNTFSGPFLNSDCLVVEYDDVLQSPEFVFLYNIIKAKPQEISKVFKMESIYKSIHTVNDLFVWYLGRPNKEVFYNIEPTDIGYAMMNELFKSDDIAENYKNFSNYFIESCIVNNLDDILKNADLSFMNVLKLITKTSLVKKIIIFSKFSEIMCKKLSKFLSEELEKEVTVFSYKNSISSILIENGVSNNSTFVFSDIMHINDLVTTKLINQSSILLADPYQYNKTPDNKFKIDLDKLAETYLFKMNYFINFDK